MTCENCSGTGKVEVSYPANADSGSIQDEQTEVKPCLDCVDKDYRRSAHRNIEWLAAYYQIDPENLEKILENLSFEEEFARICYEANIPPEIPAKLLDCVAAHHSKVEAN